MCVLCCALASLLHAIHVSRARFCADWSHMFGLYGESTLHNPALSHVYLHMTRSAQHSASMHMFVGHRSLRVSHHLSHGFSSPTSSILRGLNPVLLTQQIPLRSFSWRPLFNSTTARSLVQNSFDMLLFCTFLSTRAISLTIKILLLYEPTIEEGWWWSQRCA